jgi:two-component system, OmpR family, phosphate regulon response regulator PhoB
MTQAMARVLVIDDEPDVLLLCRVNLQHAGHDVLEAPDGERGLVQAMDQLPDAIVLDLMLPTLDGYGVLAALRDDERTRDIPVLVLTAKAQREDRVRCWEEGASEYMTKPFSPSALSSTLAQLIEMSSEQRDQRRADALRKLRDDPPG